MELIKNKITIGIDFGSTYSGFAYSYNDINAIFTSKNEKTSYCKFKTEILLINIQKMLRNEVMMHMKHFYI